MSEFCPQCGHRIGSALHIEKCSIEKVGTNCSFCGELVESNHTCLEKETIDHPSHYNKVPDIECIDVIEHFNFNLGNAIKYIWRAEHKEAIEEDLRKAIWYIERELKK